MTLSAEDRATLDACLAIKTELPERYQTIEGMTAMNDVQPTLDEVRGIFTCLERFHLRLGPPRSDEPDESEPEEGEAYLAILDEFAERRSDPQDWLAKLDRCEAVVRTPDALIGRPGATWAGVLRTWLRIEGSIMAGDAIHCIHPEREDERETRRYALERIEALALLVADRPRSGWIWFHCASLQKDSHPFAAETYHHPLAGPHVRRSVERNYFPETVAWIRAHPPASFREAPWDAPMPLPSQAPSSPSGG